MIIVSAPVQRIGFWGFSVLVRTFGSGLGDCWDRGLGLGLGLDNLLTVCNLRSPVGVSTIRKIYGIRMSHGSSPSHWHRGAGGIARKALQVRILHYLYNLF